MVSCIFTIFKSQTPCGKIINAQPNATVHHLFEQKLQTPSSFPRHRFEPGSFKLYVRDGDKSNGNAGCKIQDALKPLTMYRVKIQLRDKWVTVYVNDIQVCKEARQDRAAYKKAIVYAADPYVCAGI